ncbi:MAG TPA: hypothetical protein EYH01_08780 [Campylobacterales bacterium]|nr:hypothetical protein [Campylobacterales bacterium]
MRPVLVVQSNYINDNNYPTTIIIPFSTKLIDQAQPLRYRIKKKRKLTSRFRCFDSTYPSY